MRTIDCLDSSNIKTIEYDPDTMELRVSFKGGSVYCYTNVPQVTVGELDRASSKGAYLAQVIKPTYTCTKVQ